MQKATDAFGLVKDKTLIADFMKEMKSLKHPDSSIYNRLLKIYDLEDASEERATETYEMVKEMMEYLP